MKWLLGEVEIQFQLLRCAFEICACINLKLMADDFELQFYFVLRI